MKARHRRSSVPIQLRSRLKKIKKYFGQKTGTKELLYLIMLTTLTFLTHTKRLVPRAGLPRTASSLLACRLSLLEAKHRLERRVWAQSYERTGL